MLAKNHVYRSRHAPIRTISTHHVVATGHRIDGIRADLRVVRLAIENVPVDPGHRIERLVRIVDALLVRAALHAVREDVQDLIADHVVEERLHLAVPRVPVVPHRVAVVLLSSAVPEVVQEDEARENPARCEERVEDLEMIEIGRNNQFEDVGGDETRLPGLEVVVDHHVQPVENTDTQTVDDVDEHVEHHALQGLGTCSEKGFLDDRKAIEAARHEHKKNRGSGVDDDDEREQELPRGPMGERTEREEESTS